MFVRMAVFRSTENTQMGVGYEKTSSLSIPTLTMWNTEKGEHEYSQNPAKACYVEERL